MRKKTTEPGCQDATGRMWKDKQTAVMDAAERSGGGFPRQGSCDLPGSSVSAVVKP